MVFTGGDPLKRPDLFDLARYAVRIGLRTNVTPSATPLLTNEAIDRFKGAGVSRMAISVDGPDAATHDDFRGIPGTFDRAMAALRHARDIGLDTQFQTTVTRRNMHRLPEMAEIVKEVRSKMWSLFFLIVTGRRWRTTTCRRRVRTGLRVHVRALQDRALRHQDHRGDALPPLRGAAHQGRARRSPKTRAPRAWPFGRRASATARVSCSSRTPARSSHPASCP
jgi:MoaA/NifB/PqqE/SkfB family radical SAM enzyme